MLWFHRPQAGCGWRFKFCLMEPIQTPKPTRPRNARSRTNTVKAQARRNSAQIGRLQQQLRETRLGTANENRQIEQANAKLQVALDLVNKSHYEPKYVHYLETLLDCSSMGKRVRTPDEYSSPTGLYPSEVQFEVSIDQVANPNGDFVLYVQPNPRELAFASPPTGRGTWSDPTTDLSIKSDHNVDKLFSCCEEPLYLAGNNVGQGVAGVDVGYHQETMPWIKNGPGAGIIGTNAYVLPSTAKYSTAQWIDTSVSWTLPGSGGTASGVYGSGGVGSLAGWNQFNPSIINRSNTLVTNLRASIVVIEYDPKGTVLGWFRTQAGPGTDDVWGSFSQTGALSEILSDRIELVYDPVNFPLSVYDWEAIVYNPSQSLTSQLLLNIDCKPENYYGVAVYLQSSSSNNGTTMSLEIQSLPRLSEFATPCSIARYIRPVAQNILVTNVQPVLLKSGRLIACEVPPGTREQIFSDAEESLTRYEYLSTQTYPNGKYTGNAALGTYGVRVPQFPLWKDFVPLIALKELDYGGFVVCGNINGLPAGLSRTFNIKINTLYEYTTTSPIVDPRVSVGNPTTLYDVVNQIATRPHVWENNTHMKKIAAILTKAMFPIVAIADGTMQKSVEQLRKTSVGKPIMDVMDAALKTVPGYDPNDLIGSVLSIASKAAMMF